MTMRTMTRTLKIYALPMMVAASMITACGPTKRTPPKTGAKASADKAAADKVAAAQAAAAALATTPDGSSPTQGVKPPATKAEAMKEAVLTPGSSTLQIDTIQDIKSVIFRVQEAATDKSLPARLHLIITDSKNVKAKANIVDRAGFTSGQADNTAPATTAAAPATGVRPNNGLTAQVKDIYTTTNDLSFKCLDQGGDLSQLSVLKCKKLEITLSVMTTTTTDGKQQFKQIKITRNHTENYPVDQLKDGQPNTDSSDSVFHGTGQKDVNDVELATVTTVPTSTQGSVAAETRSYETWFIKSRNDKLNINKPFWFAPPADEKTSYLVHIAGLLLNEGGKNYDYKFDKIDKSTVYDLTLNRSVIGSVNDNASVVLRISANGDAQNATAPQGNAASAQPAQTGGQTAPGQGLPIPASRAQGAPTGNIVSFGGGADQALANTVKLTVDKSSVVKGGKIVVSWSAPNIKELGIFDNNKTQIYRGPVNSGSKEVTLLATGFMGYSLYAIFPSGAWVQITATVQVVDSTSVTTAASVAAPATAAPTVVAVEPTPSQLPMSEPMGSAGTGYIN